MTISIPSTLTLTNFADLTYPSTGTIGRVILLRGTLALGLTLTVNAATNELTTATAHGLVTGSRVRVASTTTVPTPLSATTDYYAIVTSPTVIKLAATLTDALSATAIDLTDVGTGTVTLNEQDVTAADSIAVLVNKELPSTGGYSRLAIDNVGAATVVGTNGEKPAKTVVFTNSGTANIEYKHHLIAFGASSTIGSSSGVTAYFLATETAIQSTVPGQTRSITLNMRAKPA